MGRRPKPFTQADVTRAAKGALQAGLNVNRIEIDPAGKIVIVSASKADADAPERDALKVLDRDGNDFDECFRT
jgi:hypothetical protein